MSPEPMSRDKNVTRRYGAGANSLHHLTASILSEGGSVLDVGCGRGYLAQIAHADVDGIEVDADRAREAGAWCRHVHQLSADEPALTQRLSGPYDALVFIDVLEHFADPSAVLENLLPCLAPGGQVIAIIPNVAHISQRIRLLRGQWAYLDEGILDRTHLRFYTWETAADLLRDAGLAVQTHNAVLAVPRALRLLPASITSRWPNLFGQHTIVVARHRVA